MSVYNLSPLPFVRSALLPHTVNPMRETVPSLCVPRQRFQLSLHVRCVRGIGMFRLKIVRALSRSLVRPFFHQSIGLS